MKTFELLLHTTGIHYQVDGTGNQSPALGYHAVCRAKAPDPEEAMNVVLEKFRTDPDLIAIAESGKRAGLKPKTEVEVIHQVPWWKIILPWKMPGLIFYDKEEAEAQE
jgi:hypothetical protein